MLDDIINTEADMLTHSLASDGSELLQTLRDNAADVALVDNDLPLNKEFLLLKQIFSEVPVPVVLLVTRSMLSLQLVKQATELGVYAIILKPGRGQYINYRGIAPEVISKVRAVRQTLHWDTKTRLAQLQQELFAGPQLPFPHLQATAGTVVVIGASTGGTQALEIIVKGLSPALQASVLVVVHLPKSFTKTFAARLQELTQLKVAEGREGMTLKRGKIIVAPGGKNMVVVPVMGNTANLKIGFSSEPAGSFDQPNIDLVMQTVAQSSVKQVLGVILTGMGKDGTAGAAYIRRRGGLIVAQDEETSLIFGMAKSAIDSGLVGRILPLSAIPHYINRLAAQQPSVSATDTSV
ncbi:chemotaxis protein CheB [Pontibacter sp. 172403-2]|nr:CheB methylesterase domain-containing protein [Pontibacter sp. 172403-2]MBF9255615.1 chemotaxis protein CheB [Pontibacter sp. 172403-2]